MIPAHLLERYQQDFYSQTDLVYRFGMILTLSKDGAERVTELTFNRLVEEFASLKSSIDPVKYLLERAWKTWLGFKGEKFIESTSALAKSLKTMTLDERVAMFLIDMVGLKVQEAAFLTNTSEKDSRLALASGRQRMTKGEARF